MIQNECLQAIYNMVKISTCGKVAIFTVLFNTITKIFKLNMKEDNYLILF